MTLFHIQVGPVTHEVCDESEAAAVQTLAVRLNVSPHLLEVVR
jgi:hypothetical protein